MVDEAGEPLLREDAEEEVGANTKGKGAIRLKDDEEGPSMG